MSISSFPEKEMKKAIKSCSTSLKIKEMQHKVIVGYNFSSIKFARVLRIDPYFGWKDCKCDF